MNVLKGNKGMTLLELIVVVTVLGVMLTVGGPNLMNWLEKGRQREAAYELASVIRLARAQALELGNRTGIKISIGGETDIDGDGGFEDYILFVDSDSNLDYTMGEQVIIDKEWGRGASIDASTDGIGDITRLIYKPSGLIEVNPNGNDTTITIDDYQVTISNITGRVMVDEN
ncbi:MAG: GspH/FimT family pseudopilin [Chloroflexota bacterium]|nr:GspH/FimT family pseudopilin [Chloroflexota bacterium]